MRSKPRQILDFSLLSTVLLFENFTWYILIIFLPLPQLLPDPHRPPYPPNFKTFLFYKRKKNHGVPFVLANYTQVLGSAWSTVTTPSVTPLGEKNWFSFFRLLSITNSFLAGVPTSTPLHCSFLGLTTENSLPTETSLIHLTGCLHI